MYFLLVAQACFATVFGTPNDKWDGDVAACSGRPLTEYKMGIAHRSLPCGTKVRVSNPRNGKSVVAYVVDRGPYGAGTWGHDWYVKRKENEPPPAALCQEIGDKKCKPRPWRGCVDMLPAVGTAVGIRGRGKVILKVIKKGKHKRRRLSKKRS